MDAFNSLLLHNIQINGFDFHPKCEKLQLTNVYFTDDLFLISGATVRSFKVIHKTLDEFGNMFGLNPNLDKSVCFFAGTSDRNMDKLSSILNISIGALPVRYLGVPLTTWQLRASDCRRLIDNIKNKIDQWKHRHVSYAGRVTLINCLVWYHELLGSMSISAQCLFLPIEVCNEIEKHVRAFLWSGSNLNKYKSKVAWAQVGKRKKEGGLEIKRLHEWNQACMCFHIWNLCSMKETLWVQWINTYRLNGCSFWSLSGKSTDRWVWRKLIRLKDFIRQHITIKIGTGENCNFLFDN
ncbi:reverse transcriptase [Lithospermum erythrorhizon]|uniref:Reverse transcriptase n=1 Tax=Lithospermum erythrorhizon TaxID=34254 RepID=A0AAV3Q8A4_LITER